MYDAHFHDHVPRQLLPVYDEPMIYHQAFSLETVKMFRDDAVKAGFRIDA